jgi:hypothetical protein
MVALWFAVAGPAGGAPRRGLVGVEEKEKEKLEKGLA